MRALEELDQDFPDVRILMVYIREAHAEDEWQVKVNVGAKVCFPQPRTFEERCTAARRMIDELSLALPVGVDDMDDSVSRPWGAWPERFYVIDARGVIAYQGKEGPRGFDLAEARSFLEQHLARADIPR